MEGLRKEADQLIGFCGLRFIDETPEIEILYGLWPEFWRKGFATEAARAVLRYGFEVCGLDRIVAGADPPNSASLRVMERLGMKFDRQDRRNELEVIYYALTREEAAPVYKNKTTIKTFKEYHRLTRMLIANPMPLP